MFTYTYSISATFPGGFSSGQLDSEIKANATLAPQYEGLATSDNTLNVYFTAELSPGDFTIFQNIINTFVLATPVTPDDEYQLIPRTVVNSASYTIQRTDVTIAVTYTITGAVTLTLPAASSVTAGKVYYIVDEGGNAQNNNITVNRSGSDTIIGFTSTIINLNYMGVGLYSNGTNRWLFF